jgi:hypothetical protein
MTLRRWKVALYRYAEGGLGTIFFGKTEITPKVIWAMPPDSYADGCALLEVVNERDTIMWSQMFPNRFNMPGGGGQIEINLAPVTLSESFTIEVFTIGDLLFWMKQTQSVNVSKREFYTKKPERLSWAKFGF